VRGKKDEGEEKERDKNNKTTMKLFLLAFLLPFVNYYRFCYVA
jgi:hypothetical protein